VIKFLFKSRNLPKSSSRKIVLCLAVIFILAFFGTKALFHPGFYTSHDGWHQVARLYWFDQALRDGQYPPRLVNQLFYGFGYPLFTFSYHLPWWMAEPFLLIGFSVFDAIKAVFFLGFLLSGVFFFLWQRDLWGEEGGLAAAILYMWAPYHFSNIFVRAALGEATGFIFLPLIFWSIAGRREKFDFWPVLIGAIGIVGVFLSHAMLVYIFFLPLSLYFLINFLVAKNRRVYLFSSFLTLILGICLSSYYLLPALVFEPLTNFADLMQDFYQGHFAPLSSLIYSKWSYGFSGNDLNRMSFQVGIAQWLALALCFLIFMAVFLKRKKQERNFVLAQVFFLSFFFSIFMTTSASSLIWHGLKRFPVVDFPWRYLSLAVFSGSVLSGFVISRFKGFGRHLFFFLFLLVAIYTNRNHIRVNQYTFIPLSTYVSSEATTNLIDEYLPKWIERDEFRKIRKDESRLLAKSPEIKFSEPIIKTNSLEFSYKASREEKITVNIIYFPDFKVFLDGKFYLMAREEGGVIKFLVPAGEHRVFVKYEDSWAGKLGNGLTVLGLGVCLVGLIRKKE